MSEKKPELIACESTFCYCEVQTCDPLQFIFHNGLSKLYCIKLDGRFQCLGKINQISLIQFCVLYGLFAIDTNFLFKVSHSPWSYRFHIWIKQYRSSIISLLHQKLADLNLHCPEKKI